MWDSLVVCCLDKLCCCPVREEAVHPCQREFRLGRELCLCVWVGGGGMVSRVQGSGNAEAFSEGPGCELKGTHKLRTIELPSRWEVSAQLWTLMQGQNFASLRYTPSVTSSSIGGRRIGVCPSLEQVPHVKPRLLELRADGMSCHSEESACVNSLSRRLNAHQDRREH